MRRLVVLVVGTGLVLTGVPAVAAVPAGGAAAERAALAVLDRAARAGRVLDYSGTQHVAAWQTAAGGGTLADVRHRSGRRAVVTAPSPAGDSRLPLSPTAALDPRHLQLLAASHDLRLAGEGRCAGRTTSVVEARRDGRVTGRFWVDRDSGLLLRREVYDPDGRRVRSSAFVELDVRGASPVARGAGVRDAVAAAEPVAEPVTEPVTATAAELRARGWEVPEGLPHGFRLFEAQLSTPRPQQHVLHLAYSDGLSTTSLFAQTGRLGTAPLAGFERDEVDRRPVWVRHESPERVVWSGGGRVWTLVSDASADAVHDAVAALPRDPAPRDDLRARLARGLARLASLLNPFG